MKKILKGLLFTSLLTLGAGTTALPTTTAKADYYGFNSIRSATVTIRAAGATLYNSNGVSLNRYLPSGSVWKTNLENTLNSGSYYGVGANEYVKSSDISLNISGSSQDVSQQYDGVAITNPNGAVIYDAQGNPIGKTLPDNSDWKVDYLNNLVNGSFYRVGVGEYVSASDVRPYQNAVDYPRNEIITTRSGVPTTIYDGTGQAITGRALAPNTKWYTDEFRDFSHMGFYRVATNEYVLAADVE